MMPFMHRFPSPTVMVFLFAFLFFPSISTGQTQDAVGYFDQGVKAFNAEDYREAHPIFQKAVEENPANLEAQYLLAVTKIKLQKYDEALGILQYLVKRDPERYFKAYFDVTGIYFRYERYGAILDTLLNAEAVRPATGRIYLERGYALKHLGRYDEAVRSLLQAGEYEPGLLQTIYYDIGIIYFTEKRYDESEDMFRKSEQLDPDTPRAREARVAIQNVRAARRAERRWYLSTSFEWGYDSNVPLNALGGVADPVTGVLGEGDQFQTFTLYTGYRFLSREDLQLGAGYSLYTRGYQDWTVNNLIGHTPNVYLIYNLKPVLFKLQYDFSYYRSGADSDGGNDLWFLTFGKGSEELLLMHSVSPTISIFEAGNWRTDVLLNYQWKDYRDNITPDADRYSAGVFQYFQIPQRQIYPRIGYRYINEDADISAASYDMHEFHAGVAGEIYWGIYGDFTLRYSKTNYGDSNFFMPYGYSGNLKQRTYGLLFSLKRRFFEGLYLEAYYSHYKNNSNWPVDPDIYKYDKNVFIMKATYVF